MRIAVIGANGQLGADVVRSATDAGHEVLALTHAEVDIVDLAALDGALGQMRPEVVVNTAAMNHVEGCEADPAKALFVNGVGVRNVAVATSRLGMKLVHISTDYVFRGDKGSPYVESDAPGPLNAYGASKLVGEYFVTALQPQHFVVRTSALYGVNRCRAKPQDNFVRAMLKLGRADREMRVDAEGRVSPTWTADLARQLMSLLETDHFGTYHATSQGDCSWLEFAQAIMEIAGIPATVLPREADPKNAPLRRPANSVLLNDALQRLGLDLMPPWRQSLERYLEVIGETSGEAVGANRELAG